MFETDRKCCIFLLKYVEIYPRKNFILKTDNIINHHLVRKNDERLTHCIRWILLSGNGYRTFDILSDENGVFKCIRNSYQSWGIFLNYIKTTWLKKILPSKKIWNYVDIKNLFNHSIWRSIHEDIANSNFLFLQKNLKLFQISL